MTLKLSDAAHAETIIPPGLNFKVTGVDSSGRLILEQQ